MNKIYLTIGIIILVVLSFICGKHSLTLSESNTTIIYDTLYRDSTITKIEFLDEYESLYFDLQSILFELRDSVSRLEPSILYDTITQKIEVYIPLSEYTFTDDTTYTFKVKGYNVSFVNSEIYTKTIHETLSVPDKNFFIFASGESFLAKTGNSFGIGIGLDYRKNNWEIGGKYLLTTEGNYYSIGVKRVILSF